MGIFIVAYDLKTPGKDYSSLIKAIESVPHCHAQKSLWFIQHDGPPATIRDILMKHMDSNDVLFVDAISASWAGLHMPTCGKWLNERGR